MHGMIIDVKVDPNQEEEARTMLNNIVVPRAKTHQGIIAGYWRRDMGGDMLKNH